MKRPTGVALILIAIFFVFSMSHVLTSEASLTAARPAPVVIPGSLAHRTAQDLPHEQTEIAQSAVQQIAALEIEKESRTLVQQKIDSQLLYATRKWRGQSLTPGIQTLT